jgi:hypothetical protein
MEYGLLNNLPNSFRTGHLFDDFFSMLKGQRLVFPDLGIVFLTKFNESQAFPFAFGLFLLRINSAVPLKDGEPFHTDPEPEKPFYTITALTTSPEV